ncbi:hypothetical protein ACFWYM_44480, partial [Streptomyces sp. NPDC059009]
MIDEQSCVIKAPGSVEGWDRDAGWAFHEFAGGRCGLREQVFMTDGERRYLAAEFFRRPGGRRRGHGSGRAHLDCVAGPAQNGDTPSNIA